MWRPRRPGATAQGGERWDIALLVIPGLLSVVSLVALSSAAATLNPSLVVRQAVWIVVGISVALALGSFSYVRWVDLAGLVYVGTVALLLVVLVAGTVKLGASRWLSIVGLSVQPSELAKVATACCVARMLAGRSVPLTWRDVGLSGALVALPAALVFLQPDLGTSSVFVVIWLGTVCAAGISARSLRVLGLWALCLVPLGWHALKEYQRLRLAVFLDPHADPLGAGYTIIQSKIAIGGGGLLGRGWLAGTQNQLNFLPERHADFLYSVIGEEWGFVGSVLVVCLFGWFLWRAINLALRHVEPQGRLLAVALSSWIGYQAVVNMAMVMGLVPVVGIPLPFISYGGSAMVSTWVAVGLLQSLARFQTRV